MQKHPLSHINLNVCAAWKHDSSPQAPGFLIKEVTTSLKPGVLSQKRYGMHIDARNAPDHPRNPAVRHIPRQSLRAAHVALADNGRVFQRALFCLVSVSRRANQTASGVTTSTAVSSEWDNCLSRLISITNLSGLKAARQRSAYALNVPPFA